AREEGGGRAVDGGPPRGHLAAGLAVGAAERPQGGDAPRLRAGGGLPRRDPHPGRRGIDRRRRPGRGQRAQGGAGPGRVPLHRGEAPGGVRGLHPGGPGAGGRLHGGGGGEPTVAEEVGVLSGLLGRYEEHHRVRYARAAVEAAASLAARYVTDRHNPDKAVSIVDLVGSRVARAGRDRVEVRDVAEVVARIAGLPVERLLTGDAARLLRLEEELGARVVGHGAAVERVAKVLRRNYAGFASRRPLGSFLFLGPTGVGKTELARALADVLFGTRDALIR